MQSDRLVLGIDGGGTKTVAWLAACGPSDEPSVVGRGTAGAANPQAVGFQRSLESLDRAIDAAFEDAEVPSGPVAAAVLGLAGSDRDENRTVLGQWAQDRHVARRFRLVHDALPVLLAGSPQGWGVALISGTGSLAFGQDRHGTSARAGGWGLLFGDEGSGYAIAVAGLRAVAQAADGRGPATKLREAILSQLRLQRPEELVSTVYRVKAAAIASLAEVVIRTAGENDAVAQEIIHQAADDLAAMVTAVAEKLDFTSTAFPLALAGGVLLGCADLQLGLLDHLRRLGLRPEPVADVAHPVLGSVRLAQLEAPRQD